MFRGKKQKTWEDIIKLHITVENTPNSRNIIKLSHNRLQKTY